MKPTKLYIPIGRWICGCWGLRDFNAWELCKGCSEANPMAIIATFAGPIFTFLMIWIGAFWLMQSSNERKKAMGFSLIFANMPFAKILTASLGGGDEVWGLNQLLNNHSWAWSLGLFIIVSITVFPLWKAYHFIQNKHKIGLFLLFFLAPTFIDLLAVVGLLNTLLQKGILNQSWILGSPMLVSVWTMFVLCVFFFTRENIYSLRESKDQNENN